MIQDERRRWMRRAALLALAALSHPSRGQSQSSSAAATPRPQATAGLAPGGQPVWPGGPLRILLVYPPGGVSDGVVRWLAQALTGALGVPVRVEYRPGASGSLGLEALAQAAPDGLTLAFSALSPLTLYPQLARVRYDPLRDFAPVASVMLTPSMLVGTPAFQGVRAADLLAQAQAEPGRLRWATTGAGTTGHLVLVQWQRLTGAQVTHIPYKGGGQQIADALAGQFELLSTNVGAAQLQHIRDGRLKPLVVGAPRRLPALPDVPTWAELGWPGANLSSEFVVLAPAATPAALVARLNAEINRALATPALQAALLSADNLPTGGPPQALAQRIQQEFASHRALLREVTIRMD